MRKANLKFFTDHELPAPFSAICRGEDGCGMPLLSRDKDRHIRYHSKILDLLPVVEDLSGMGGANDVPTFADQFDQEKGIEDL